MPVFLFSNRYLSATTAESAADPQLMVARCTSNKDEKMRARNDQIARRFGAYVACFFITADLDVMTDQLQTLDHINSNVQGCDNIQEPAALVGAGNP